MYWLLHYDWFLQVLDVYGIWRRRLSVVGNIKGLVDWFSILCSLVDDNHRAMERVLSSGGILQEINIVDCKPDVHTVFHKVRQTKPTRGFSCAVGHLAPIASQGRGFF